ncbi:tyrosine-type recombinase/integrase [Pseudoclavibacter alba]|uniref:Tyrosine-type recombinase/integrase n=1 Tax=Pseudoclavibacter albus TaxID=272241 RepID=A0ABT2HUD1_9MICO|nr:tyrosine-type recombinase/integrase [Pseudoclavibacter alba]MCT2041924.1 tyrosine-type recombinase/integrase [Pseudoclavibacter alba]
MPQEVELTSSKRNYPKNRESWGSIRERGKRLYASYVGPDGERYQAPTSYTTKGDARAWLTEQRSLIEKGKWKSPKAASAEQFGVYASAWLDQRTTSKGKPLAARTRAEYRRQLDNGLADFKDMPVTGFTPAVVRAWHSKRIKKGATQAAREAALLRAILSTAVEDGILEKNPVKGHMTKASTGITHRPPTTEELAHLVQLMPDEWRAAVLLAAFGGLRLSEWRALRRSDLTLTDGRYTVDVTRQAVRVPGEGWHVGPPKSEEGVRMVTLPSHVTPALTEHLARHVGQLPACLLFEPKGHGDFIDDQRFNKPWTEARRQVGVEGVVREHDLRAFAGTTFAQSGATMRETMAFLGHSTTTAAMAYQATTGREAELAERMPALPAVTSDPLGTVTPFNTASA